MSIHLQLAIRNLKQKMLLLSTLVEESVRQAVDALEKRDLDAAMTVIGGDNQIDDMEIEVEEDCLKILALYQPVAIDLRFIVASLKINNDLERVGDLAVNISERAAYLAGQKPIDVGLDFHSMADKAQWMLKSALDALVNNDAGLAWKVIVADDEVDAMNREMYVLVQQAIPDNLDELNTLIHMLSTSRHLERMGDLATNIAEDVIYMSTGEIVRHRTEEYLHEQEEAKNT